MKKLIVLSALVLGGLSYQSASAQISFHVGINLTPRPVYVEPAPVYNDADYYYLPDVEAYYSVNQNRYYYQDGGSWISAAYLPGRYHDYDWRHANHYAVNEPRPYMHNDVYRARYGGFEGRRDWNNRDEHNVRAYANNDRFNHEQYRGNNNRGGNFGQRNDDHGNFGGRNDHQQPQQQNDNRGNFGGNRSGGQQQPQQNDNHSNAGGNRGGQPQQAQPQNGNRGNDNNNRGNNDNREGRNGRF